MSPLPSSAPSPSCADHRRCRRLLGIPPPSLALGSVPGAGQAAVVDIRQRARRRAREVRRSRRPWLERHDIETAVATIGAHDVASRTVLCTRPRQPVAAAAQAPESGLHCPLPARATQIRLLSLSPCAAEALLRVAPPGSNSRSCAGPRAPTVRFEDGRGRGRGRRSKRSSTSCLGPKVDVDEQPKEWFDARKPKELGELEVDCFLEQYRKMRLAEVREEAKAGFAV